MERMDRSYCTSRQPPQRFRLPAIILAVVAVVSPLVQPASAQDQLNGGINQGVSTIRIAVADFKPRNADPQSAALKTTFDATLYADLATAGIFDIVSKSLMPPGSPGAPSEMQLPAYANAPASAAFVAFGSIGVTGGKLVTNGYLFDAKNQAYPQVLAKQYNEEA